MLITLAEWHGPKTKTKVRVVSKDGEVLTEKNTSTSMTEVIEV